MITLERFAYSPHGTFGRLIVPNKIACFTVERPWAENRAGESCIPEGRYQLRMRPSPVVKRSSGGEFLQGWEVVDVPGRSLIMLHPGNTALDVQGCISPGDSLGCVEGRWAVLRSRETFKALMSALAGLDGWNLEITSIRAGQLPAESQRAFA